MPRLTIDITDELANELLSRRVDAVGMCLTALRDAVNGSGMTQKPGKTMGRPPKAAGRERCTWYIEKPIQELIEARARERGLSRSDILNEILAEALRKDLADETR